MMPSHSNQERSEKQMTDAGFDPRSRPLTPPLSPRAVSLPIISKKVEEPFPVKKGTNAVPISGANVNTNHTNNFNNAMNQFNHAYYTNNNSDNSGFGNTNNNNTNNNNNPFHLNLNRPEPTRLEAKRTSFSFFPEKVGGNGGNGGGGGGSSSAHHSPVHTPPPQRSNTAPNVLTLSPAPSLKPTPFVAQMFDEHKNSHAILYNRFEDPFENENHEPFGWDIIGNKNQKSNQRNNHHHHGNNKTPVTPSSASHSQFAVTPSPTFRTTAPEFLRKWNSEELVKEPAAGDIVGTYQLGDVIGMGAFSTVRQGFFAQKPELKVAIKITDKKSCDESLLTSVYNEIRIWQTLNHPHIVKFLDVIENNRHIYVVCALCSRGRLFDLVVNSELGRLEDHDAKKSFLQIAQAIQYLHHLDITHGDIKLDNLLLDEDGKIQLCDFGFSVMEEQRGRAGDGKKSTSRSVSPDTEKEYDLDHLITNHGGTLLYSAPEVIKGNAREIGKPSDIWSAGVTLFAMTMGELPFDDDYEPRLKAQILSGRFTFPDDVEFCSELQDLIQGMMKVSVSERLTIDQVLGHPWFQ